MAEAEGAAKAALASNNYKQLKESFYSGHNGGSIVEIIQVTAILNVSILAWSALQSHLRLFSTLSPNRATFLALSTDWLLNCAATLASLTIYSGSPILLDALLLLPAIIVKLTIPARKHPNANRSRSFRSQPTHRAELVSHESVVTKPTLPRKPCVTMYRGSMMVITCIAILAVDFPVFPRRFAKVENWGTSLMDLGVGSFVFASGLMSARAILRSNRKSLPERLHEAIRQSFALLLLGMIRLASVKGVDYAEHVTEYGVHWNFFFTLGFLPPFVAVFQELFAFLPSYPALSLLLAVAYEILLDNTRLTVYIITAPRDNLISQNREGIFSFIGYLSIFLAGQGAGLFILPRENNDKPKVKGVPSLLRQTTLFASSLKGNLLILGFVYGFVFYITTTYQGLNLRVSRRLANLPYVLWVCAFNYFQLAVCTIIEDYFFPTLYSASSAIEEEKRIHSAASPILRAFNRNGLAIFLVANLLTGVINLTFDTIQMNNHYSLILLTIYTAILAGIAVGLDMYDIDVKI